ncbi:MAG: hypothetical protein EAX96_01480 [Candidatus Lokiarchaeota archaeon]|nr:hypothetical protein [Candidatus Lokiarchaeota archaeon]
MIDSEKIISSLKIPNEENFRLNFLENSRLFNLNNREAKIFLLLFNLYRSDNKARFNYNRIYNQIQEERNPKISEIHIRNVLNTLVKKKFINYEISHNKITLSTLKSRYKGEQFDNELRRIKDEDLKKIIDELEKNLKLEDFEVKKPEIKDKNFELYKKLIISDLHALLNDLIPKKIELDDLQFQKKIFTNFNKRLENIIDNSFSNINVHLPFEIKENFKIKLKKNIEKLQLAIKNKDTSKSKGKKPRLYFFDEELIRKKIRTLEKKFENIFITSTFGFSLIPDEVKILIQNLNYINLVQIEDVNLERFYEIYLSKDENILRKQFNSINSISNLSNPKFTVQKVRKLVNILIKKGILREIIPSEETSLLEKLLETSDLLKNLRKNEKIYQLLPAELAIRKLVLQTIREHTLKMDILNSFLKDYDSDFKPSEIFKPSHTEIFQDLKKSFNLINKLEKEFEEIKIYKEIFEKLDYGIIIFENEFLKYFDYKARNIFNLLESEKSQLHYLEFLFNKDITYSSERGKENLRERLEDPRLRWNINVEVLGINYKMSILSDLIEKRKLYIIIE